MPSNGGLTLPLNLMLIPAGSGVIYSFSISNFNDAHSAGSYSYKVEDIIAGRIPTIRRVIISYRDLGKATITVVLSGIDANTQTPAPPASQLVNIGTVGASNKICTQLVDLTLTGMNLQLTIQRAANAGPVSITKVRLEGTVEKTTY